MGEGCQCLLALLFIPTNEKEVVQHLDHMPHLIVVTEGMGQGAGDSFKDLAGGASTHWQPEVVIELIIKGKAY